MNKYLIFLFVVVSGCIGSPEISEKNTRKNSGLITEGLDTSDNLPSLRDFLIEDTFFLYKGLKIFPVVFHNKDNPQYSLAILSQGTDKTDTIYTQLLGAPNSIGFKFMDYNCEGHPDLDVFFSDSFSFSRELLFLYDPELNTYKELKDFDEYRQSEVLDSNLGLRYSYYATVNSVGLAWVSNLFSIRNKEIIHYAALYFDMHHSPYYTLKQNGKPETRKEIKFKDKLEKDTFDKFEWMFKFWKNEVQSKKVKVR